MPKMTIEKATAMMRITPAVREALRKRRVGRETYSDVIARLLAQKRKEILEKW